MEPPLRLAASKIVRRFICECCCVRKNFDCFENFLGILLDPRGCCLMCCVVLIGNESFTEVLAMLGCSGIGNVSDLLGTDGR